MNGLATEQYVDHLELGIYHLLDLYGQYTHAGTSATNPDAIFIRKFCSRFAIEPYTEAHMILKRKTEAGK